MEPRGLTISPDGSALHVGSHPIGITDEPRTGRVWVTNYPGSIDAFDDNHATTLE